MDGRESQLHILITCKKLEMNQYVWGEVFKNYKDR